MSGVNMHSWLRRIPMPHALRLDKKDRVIIGDGKNRWKDALDVINESQPSIVEALNADGDVIRMTRLDYQTPRSAVDEYADKPSPDPQFNRDVAMARVIMEAGDRGAQRHAEESRVAFDALREVVSMIADRLTGVEQAWQETLDRRARDLESTPTSDSADPAGDAIANMIGQAVVNGPKAAEQAVAKEVTRKVVDIRRKPPEKARKR